MEFSIEHQPGPGDIEGYWLLQRIILIIELYFDYHSVKNDLIFAK